MKTLIYIVLLKEAYRRKVDIYSCTCVGLPFFTTQWRCADTLINECPFWRMKLIFGKTMESSFISLGKKCLSWSCSIFLLCSYWMPIKMYVLRCVFHMGGFCGVSQGIFFANHLASGLITSSLWIMFVVEIRWRLRENWFFSLPFYRLFFHRLKPLHDSFCFSICPFWRKLQFLRNEWKKLEQLNLTYSLSLCAFLSPDEARPGLRYAFAENKDHRWIQL